jgi:hypothetical protein
MEDEDDEEENDEEDEDGMDEEEEEEMGENKVEDYTAFAVLAKKFLSPVADTILINLFGSESLDAALVAKFYHCVGLGDTKHLMTLTARSGKSSDDAQSDAVSQRREELKQSGSFFIRHLGTVTTPTPDSCRIVPNSCLAYTYTCNKHYILYTYTERSLFLMQYLRSLHATPKSMVRRLASLIGNEGVGRAYEIDAINNFTASDNVTVFSDEKCTNGVVIPFNNAYTNWDMRTIAAIALKTDSNAWSVPAISNFRIIDLFGISREHDIVAFQITTSDKRPIAETSRGTFKRTIVKLISAMRSRQPPVQVKNVYFVICCPDPESFKSANYVKFVKDAEILSSCLLWLRLVEFDYRL